MFHRHPRLHIRPLAAALAVLAGAVGVANAAPAVSDNGLDAVRQECVAAAAELQHREQAIPQLEHALDLLGRDLAGRQRGLAESRGEQAQLLGEIERVAAHPPDRFVVLPEAPVDRIRARLLLDAVAPALHAEAQALAAEFARVAALRSEIATRQQELATSREALATAHEHLGELIRRRLAIERQLQPADTLTPAQLTRLEHEAKDLGDLVKRADIAADRRGKASADPTKPPGLRPFDPAAEHLTMPVSGQIAIGFTEGASAGEGIGIAGPAGGVVVAPFSGRVTYAGAFGSRGLVLIIRHGGLYHSLLAGLGRVDVRVGDWVVAGEPVGAMSEKTGVVLEVELRREGHPVDPQPWLAGGGSDGREPARGAPDGDQKVR